MPSELITLDFLGGLAGLSAAVVLVVAFLKWISGLNGRGAKVAAWAVSLVLVAVFYANEGLFAVMGATAIGTALVMWLLNSILVVFVAMKGYEDVVEPITDRLRGKTGGD